jgi:hypothetical protein
MVLRGRLGESSYIISLKAHSCAVMVDEAWVVAYDRGGRLFSVHRDQRAFRRGLGGQVLEKWQENGVRHHRIVPVPAAEELVDQSASLLRRVLAGLPTRLWSWDEPAESGAVEDALATLGRASRFDAAAALADEEAFRVLYRPIGILPPDQYLAVVLQATEGCSFNACTFCDLYHVGYRVKTADEFDHHVTDVLAWLGESRALRSRGVFLGAANALAVPMARLRAMFSCIASRLAPDAPPVCAFVDGFTGSRLTVDDYAELRALGLRRVYVGLESGHNPLLEFVRKPGDADAAVRTVRDIRAAGVEAGVIVMIGLGGERFARGHVRDTVAALTAMGLGPNDVLYFSDLVEVPGTAYPRLARKEDVRPLPPAQRRAQEKAIRAGTRFRGAPPKMAAYDVREFVY